MLILAAYAGTLPNFQANRGFHCDFVATIYYRTGACAYDKKVIEKMKQNFIFIFISLQCLLNCVEA